MRATGPRGIDPLRNPLQGEEVLRQQSTIKDRIAAPTAGVARMDGHDGIDIGSSFSLADDRELVALVIDRVSGVDDTDIAGLLQPDRGKVETIAASFRASGVDTVVGMGKSGVQPCEPANSLRVKDRRRFEVV